MVPSQSLRMIATALVSQIRAYEVPRLAPQHGSLYAILSGSVAIELPVKVLIFLARSGLQRRVGKALGSARFVLEAVSSALSRFARSGDLELDLIRRTPARLRRGIDLRPKKFSVSNTWCDMPTRRSRFLST